MPRFRFIWSSSPGELERNINYREAELEYYNLVDFSMASAGGGVMWFMATFELKPVQEVANDGKPTGG